MIVTLAERYQLIESRITLDGKPAVISGAKNDFASVRTLDGKMSLEWSWAAIKRIVANGGKFKS